MRLINVHTLKAEALPDDKTPPYAILSHTWSTKEPEYTFADLESGVDLLEQPNFKKILFLCVQARKDGLNYAWCDTCRIDKTNSVELQEAINSMFRWYQEARICYAYLSDVHLEVKDDQGKLIAMEDDNSIFHGSNWFKRGWTLQELLAPQKVVFYDSNWQLIGDKESCCPILSSITGIGINCIRNAAEMNLEMFSTRMSWVEDRETTKAEDIAYCLMGIFGVHMPLLYGEGRSKAFTRLQHELVRQRSSSSLLAWGLNSNNSISTGPGWSSIFPRSVNRLDILAQSPTHFSRQLVLKTIAILEDRSKAWVHTNRGFKIKLLLVESPDWYLFADEEGISQRHDLAIAILPFKLPGNSFECPGVLLSGNSLERIYNRISCPNGYPSVMVPARLVSQAKISKIYLTDLPVYREVLPPTKRDKLVLVDAIGFQIHALKLHKCGWRPTDTSLVIHPNASYDTSQSVLRFLDIANLQSYFDLHISSSVIVSETIEGTIEESDHWRFLVAGQEGCDEYEESFIWGSPSESWGRAFKAQKFTISMGAKKVDVSLERNENLEWLLYTLTVSTTKAADC